MSQSSCVAGVLANNDTCDGDGSQGSSQVQPHRLKALPSAFATAAQHVALRPQLR